MKQIAFTLLISLLCLNILTAEAEVIIGEEDRITAPSTYPYSAIGRIAHRSGIFCTGFLVAKNIVVTNGYLNGTAFFQNTGGDNLNRQLFKNKMLQGVFSK